MGDILDSRTLERLRRKPLTARRAGWWIAGFTLLVTLAGGTLMWVVDGEEDIPTLGLGLWWALQTVTTVGYGDVVPTTTIGRITGAAVMLVGIGFVTVVTASITAAFVEVTRRRLALESERTHAERLDEIGDRLERIEAALSKRL